MQRLLIRWLLETALAPQTATTRSLGRLWEHQAGRSSRRLSIRRLIATVLGGLPTLQRMTLNSDLLRRSWREWITSDIDRSSPEWLQWLWTIVFALVIALGFTSFGVALNASREPGRWLDVACWGRTYRDNLAISLTVTVLIHLMFRVIIPLVGKHRIRRFSNSARAAFFTAIPLSGVAIGWPLGVWLVGQDVAGWARTMNPAEMLSSCGPRPADRTPCTPGPTPSAAPRPACASKPAASASTGPSACTGALAGLDPGTSRRLHRWTTSNTTSA